MATARTRELHALAERIAAALPPVAEEVVLTGSVSRGVADEVSDVEMLVVTPEPLGLAECFEHARTVGLVELDTWGPQGTEVPRLGTADEARRRPRQSAPDQARPPRRADRRGADRARPAARDARPRRAAGGHAGARSERAERRPSPALGARGRRGAAGGVSWSW